LIKRTTPQSLKSHYAPIKAEGLGTKCIGLLKRASRVNENGERHPWGNTGGMSGRPDLSCMTENLCETRIDTPGVANRDTGEDLFDASTKRPED